MKILFENKQLNEGPGAGYTVSGTLTNVKVNNINNIEYIEDVSTDGTLVEYEVSLDATALFTDVRANSYYYGGQIDSTPVSIVKVIVEMEKDETSKEDFEYALNGIEVEVSLGGGWAHSTFDGHLKTNYYGIKNSNDINEIEFNLTDTNAIEYLDRAVQNENTETLFEVVKDGVAEDAFEDEDEAIAYAKNYGYDEVRIIYQTQLWPEDVDVEIGDIVWTNDGMEESLKEDTNNQDQAMKEIRYLLDGILAIGPDDKINDQTDWKRLYTTASRISKMLGNKSESCSKSLTESFDDEDRINALAEYLNIDPSEISNTYDYEYETPEGDYYVVTEYEAEELAKEDIRSLYDDLGLDSFAPDFKDWIIMNALDNEWFEDAIKESYEYYVEDIEDEASSMGYENRLIEEMHDHQVLSDDDFEEDEDGMPDLRELKEDIDIDDKKEEFIDLLVENAGNPVDYCADNFGWDWVTEMATQNNLIDMDEVVEQCIYMDGIAHFIARYDGEEHELGNGLYAYRTN